MSWFDLFVKTADPGALDRARALAAEQRAAAEEKRRQVLLKAKAAAKDTTGGKIANKSIERRPIGVRYKTNGLLAPIGYREYFNGTDAVSELTPVVPGNTLSFTHTNPTPDPPPRLSYGPDGVGVTGIARDVSSPADSRYLILPYKDDMGVLIFVRSAVWGAVEYRQGRWPLHFTHGAYPALIAGIEDYRWSWVVARPDFEMFGEAGPDPTPFTDPITFSETVRQAKAFLYDTTTIREIEVPATFRDRLDGLFPYEGSPYDRGSIDGIKQFAFSGAAGESPYSWQGPSGLAAILASPYVRSPDIVWPPASVGPWSSRTNTSITGYGIQSIYGSRGWGSGVYSYLDGSGFTTDGTEAYLLEDASAHMASLGIDAAWLHQFDRSATRDVFYELTGVVPTGTLDTLYERIPGRRTGDVIDELTNPWQDTEKRADNRIDYQLETGYYSPFTDVANNNYPDYNGSKLAELGFVL